MSTIFEQIGITQEELIERIVDKALGCTAEYKQTGEESWEDLPFSEVVDNKISKALSGIIDALKPAIQEKIDCLIEKEVEKVFTSPFQRVDRWGEPKGKPITIRDIIATETQDYWSTIVDHNGKPSSEYHSDKQQRSVYYAKKVMTQVYDKELVSVVQNIAKDLKSRIPATIADEMTKTIKNYLK